MTTQTTDRRAPRSVPATLLLLIAALGLGGCPNGGGGSGASAPAGNQGGTNTAAAPAPAQPQAVPAASTGGPKLEFAKLEHDFGDITDTQKYRASFPFTNTGTEVLVIEDVKAACGCTVPTLPKTVFQPGEGSAIDITFDPKGKQGVTPKFISVISNSKGEPDIQLSLTSNIKPLLAYERMMKLGELELGKEHTQVLPLTYTDPDLRIESVTTNNPNVTVEVGEMGQVISSGDEVLYGGELVVTVSPDTPWGVIFATRAYPTVIARPLPDQEPVTKEYTLFITGQVYGEIQANPSIVSLGQMTPSQPFEQTVTLTSRSGQPFDVESVEIVETTMPGINVRSEQVAPGIYRVYVHGNAGNYTGGVKGSFLAKTNVPGEENLLMRFSGLVR